MSSNVTLTWAFALALLPLATPFGFDSAFLSIPGLREGIAQPKGQLTHTWGSCSKEWTPGS